MKPSLFNGVLFTPIPLSQSEKDLAFVVKPFSREERSIPHFNKGDIKLYTVSKPSVLLNNEKLPR